MSKIIGVINSMAYDDNNIFAKILRGELPAHKVYEDEHTLAFMDIMPMARGHTLVIPKYPAETLFDLPADLYSSLMASVDRVGRAVKVAFEYDGVMIFQLNGTQAGQTVPHLHFHLLPTHIGVLREQRHAAGMAPEAELQEAARLVREALAQLQPQG